VEHTEQEEPLDRRGQEGGQQTRRVEGADLTFGEQGKATENVRSPEGQLARSERPVERGEAREKEGQGVRAGVDSLADERRPVDDADQHQQRSER
jgi:hypothetical protein